MGIAAEIIVLFPDGERTVPAHYTRPPGEIGSPEYLAHTPSAEPDANDDWTFHRLVSGEWIAVSKSVHTKTRVPVTNRGWGHGSHDEDDGLDV